MALDEYAEKLSNDIGEPATFWHYVILEVLIITNIEDTIQKRSLLHLVVS